MRHLLLSALALLALLVGQLGAADKKKARSSNDNKKPARSSNDNSRMPEKVTEIGGKTIEQWLRDLSSTDPAVVENAIRTVVLFSHDDAKKAVPILLKKLKLYELDSSIKVNIIIALRLIGLDHEHLKEGVLRLTHILSRDSQYYVKYHAALTLSSLGRDAKAAIPNLKAKLADLSCWEVRMACAVALRSVAAPPKDEPVDATVVEALRARVARDTCSQVRLEAVQSLILLGPPADPKDRVLPPTDPRSRHPSQTAVQVRQITEQTLKVAAVKDKEPTVRIWCQVGVMRMTGKVEQSRVASIAGYLDDPVLGVRCQAARALGGVGLEAKTQVSRLVNKLDDKETIMVTWVMWALGHIGKEDPSALAKLDQIAKDPKHPLKETAAETIKAIHEVAKNVKNNKKKK
jgi:HEAT repeat protein